VESSLDPPLASISGSHSSAEKAGMITDTMDGAQVNPKVLIWVKFAYEFSLNKYMFKLANLKAVITFN